MKFYRVSSVVRVILTIVYGLSACYGAMIEHHQWPGLLLALLAILQLCSLWNQHWKISGDGMLRTSGFEG